MSSTASEAAAAHSPSRLWAVLALCAALQACGGGDGDATAPADASPTSTTSSNDAADSVTAATAHLRVLYRPFSNDADVVFVPAFANQATGYRVDRLKSGTWTAAATLTASSLPATATWTDNSGNVAESYRAVALLPGREVILKTDLGTNQANVRSDLASALSIDVNAAQPLAGAVRFSLVGAPTGASASWYVHPSPDAGSIALPIAGAGAGYGVDLDMANYADGAHLVRAVLQASASSAIEVRRQLSVDDPHFTLSGTVVADSSATVVAAYPASEATLASVKLFVDGTPAGDLSTSNLCPSSGPLHCYRLDLADSQTTSGSHVFRVVATDARGLSREWTQSFVINHSPAVSLTKPLSNAIVAGSLQIGGVVADESDTLATVVSLDGAVVGRPSAKGSFELTVDLTTYAIGAHTITVASTDAQGRSTSVSRAVQVQAAGGFGFERVADAVAVFTENYADGAAALRKDLLSNDVDALHFGAQDATVRLQPGTAALLPATLWLSQAAGSVIAVLDNGHIARWGRDGVFHDLSLEAGHALSTRTYSGNAEWISWAESAGSTTTQLVLRNLLTGEQHLIAKPTTAGTLQDPEVVVPRTGGAWLVFNARSADGKTAQRYVYDTGSHLSTLMSALPSTTVANLSKARSDGTRLVWREDAPGAVATTPSRLMAEDLAHPGTAAPLSTSVAFGSAFGARKGSVAWSDIANGNETAGLKLNDGTSTVRIADGTGSILSVGGGAVAYAQSATEAAIGGVRLWTAAKGSRLVVSAGAANVLATDGWLYFGSKLQSEPVGDTTRSLYRLAF